MATMRLGINEYSLVLCSICSYPYAASVKTKSVHVHRFALLP